MYEITRTRYEFTMIGTLYDMAQRPTQLVWARTPRQPRVTRETIASTALAIADSEGIDAVTMRRVAAELTVGTMTLYHYVTSKAELMAIMLDAIMAEQIAPTEELPVDDWRAALTILAHRGRAMLRRHPWVLGGLQYTGGSGGGPHALQHTEQSLAAVASTGLPPADRLDIIGAIDDYVAGFVLKTDLEPGLESVPDEAIAAATAYLDRELRSGKYPYMEALIGEGDSFKALRQVTSTYSADQRFEQGIRRLLDGVAAQIARAH
jgi:AcrR family transcriptional regulator